MSLGIILIMIINPMRTLLIALLMTLATRVGADTKKYGKKECNDIWGAIGTKLLK